MHRKSGIILIEFKIMFWNRSVVKNTSEHYFLQCPHQQLRLDWNEICVASLELVGYVVIALEYKRTHVQCALCISYDDLG